MAFDPDHDLTKDFNDLIGSSKKKNSKGFEFSSNTVSDKDPIAVGHDRIIGKPDGIRKKRIKPLRKGAKFIRRNI